MQKKIFIMVLLLMTLLLNISMCITPEDKVSIDVKKEWEEGISNWYKGKIPTADDDVTCTMRDEDITLDLSDSKDFKMDYKTTSIDCKCSDNTFSYTTKIEGTWKQEGNKIILTPEEDELVVSICGTEEEVDKAEKKILEFVVVEEEKEIKFVIGEYYITFEK